MPPEPWSRSENPMPPLQPAESQAETRQAMGLGADCLRLELMQMFEEGRPRLRPTPIKARHFVSTTLNGKALYESHKCEVESRWRDSAHEFLSVKDGFLSPPPMLIIERSDSECLSETSSSTSGFESSDPSGSEASSSPPSTSPIPSPPQTTVQRVVKPRCKVTVALRLHSPTMSPIREDTPSPTPPRNIESPGRRNSHARNGYHRYISGIAPKEINGSRKTDDDDDDDGLGIWSFHLNEHDDVEEARDSVPTFAGCRSLVAPEAAIKGKTGTVRGVRNRVRAGIATFLQSNGKRYTHIEAGKVVVYVTTLGIIRETFQQCLAVRTILRTLLVHFEEKDVFLCRGYQAELLDRLGHHQVVVPQVFLEGQHLGDAETIERLNEAGKLRKILRPYKRLSCSLPCSQCGGYRLLPCKSCNGSKKSIHRNHFTEEFMALRCMQCDESGLMRCTACVGKPS